MGFYVLCYDLVFIDFRALGRWLCHDAAYDNFAPLPAASAPLSHSPRTLVSDFVVPALEVAGLVALWPLVALCLMAVVGFFSALATYAHTFYTAPWDPLVFFDPVKVLAITELEFLVIETQLLFESFFLMWSVLNRTLLVLFLVATLLV